MDIDAGQQRCAAVETHVLGLEDIAYLDQAALKLAVEQQTGADTGREVEHTAHVDFGGYRGPVVGTAVYNLIFGQRRQRVDKHLAVGRVERTAVHQVADIHTAESETVVLAC